MRKWFPTKPSRHSSRTNLRKQSTSKISEADAWHHFGITEKNSPRCLSTGESFLSVIINCYPSTAACAAANEDWKSVTYRVSVKYWLLFFDTFCAFLHAHGYKNVLNGRGFSFLCKYFNFGFTLNCSTVVLQSLTVNASWVRRFWLHNTFCIFRVQKYKISLTLYTFYTFFLQNMLVLT